MSVPMVKLRLLLCGTLLMPLLCAAGCTRIADDAQSAFRFEDHEAFLGFGKSDDEAAKRNFLVAFPIGTPLDRIDAFFDGIGGRCFELPRDKPGRLICGYAHPKFRMLSFLPLLSTWSVDVWYEGEPRISTRVEVTAGTEGL
jgi:hypothetical protein